MAGKLGRKAGQQSWPNDVTITTATDVGTNRPYAASAASTEAGASGVGGSVSLAWSLPAGSAEASSYTITTTPSTYSKTVSGTSTTFEGLASNTAYTFTIKANNSVGSSAGTTSSSVTATTVPQAPTLSSATDVGTNRPYNNGSVSVAFTANATGGKSITSYTVSGGGYSASGATSPLAPTGYATGATPTFTVTATNGNGTSLASSASSAVTVTTVPDTPAAPTVSSPTPSAGVNVAGTTTDSVSWSAPANGGKAISQYTWTSSDSKSGTTAGTSVSVNQEGGTAQTYQVRAENANGAGNYSSASSSVTTFQFTPFSVFGFSPFGVFSFAPFSVFGFSPFGVFSFAPFSVFGFSPFGVFGFSPFGVFGFSPFGVFGFSPFGVFGFSPFSVFGFSPAFNFAPWG
ncbi:MAG: fibronectin type III domain-containing protein [Oxalobacteraceae bacterium]|jgi:hypothetical protein|nr:fibronectin type III domain-containing protein [Oxalobacteraceae bacterium]